MVDLEIIIFQKAPEEIRGGKTKSTIEEMRKDNDLTGVWSREFFPICWPLTDDFLRREDSVFHHLF